MNEVKHNDNRYCTDYYCYRGQSEFFKSTRIADEKGAALMFKNNRPKYKLTNLEVEPDLQLTDDEKIDIVARRIMVRFKPAFLKLAK